MDGNDMDLYLEDADPLDHDSRNLFALRYDVQLLQFDQARFVIVPKFGQLHIHFLHRSQETAMHYHNVVFDQYNTLSHELLYARFAWALAKKVKDARLSSKFSDSSDENPKTGGNGGGKGRNGKRKRTDDDGGNDGEDDGEDEDSDNSVTYRLGRSASKKKTGRSETDSFKDDDPSSSNLATPELEEDMKEAADTRHTFFIDPSRKASPNQYHNIFWYPGRRAIQRAKQAYFAANPQIRAHSDHVLPDGYEDEMFG